MWPFHLLSVIIDYVLLQAATDLLVRQKNFSLGQPNNEIDITQSDLTQS